MPVVQVALLLPGCTRGCLLPEKTLRNRFILSERKELRDLAELEVGFEPRRRDLNPEGGI